MQYPDEFKAEARRVYPTWTELHQKIEAGSSIVGRYLDDSCGSLSPHKILACFTIEEAHALAQTYLDRHDLYNQWIDLMYMG